MDEEISPAMSSVDNKHEILNFSLPNDPSKKQTYTRVLLQLFGYAGHGKSAFVNSCIYTLGSGEFQMHAESKPSDKIVTMKRKSYKLTDNITIVDNRGFGTKKNSEEAVVYAQLGHFLPLDEHVVISEDFDEIMSQVEDSDLTPNYTDFIVPIFIYSVKNIMPEEQVEEVKIFFNNCKKMTGVAPIVVFTHKFNKNYKDLEERFRCVGAEQMMAVENYTPEDHMKTRGRCTDIQNVILNALKDVRFRLQQPRDPMRERIQRKKFLLKFAHGFTVEEIKDQTEKEAKAKEYERLKALADGNWFCKFPYRKK